MKRLVSLIVILLTVLVLIACGVAKTENTDSLNIKNDISNGKTVEQVNDKQNPDKEKSLDTGNVSQFNAGVIAKSGNTVSSEEKEKVITELEKKLDSLFESINESKKVEADNITGD